MNKVNEKIPYLQGLTLASAWFLKNLQSSAFACWVSFTNVCSLLFYTEWYSIKACHFYVWNLPCLFLKNFILRRKEKRNNYVYRMLRNIEG